MDESVKELLLRLENEERKGFDLPWDMDYEHPMLQLPELLARAIEFAHVQPAHPLWMLNFQSPAHYNRGEDKIMVPRPMHFKTLDAFAGVLLHEFGHWTMKRTGRDLTNPNIEELIAEITGRTVCKHFGFERSDWSDDYLRKHLSEARVTNNKQALYEKVEYEVDLAVQCLLQHFGDYHITKEKENVDGTATS